MNRRLMVLAAVLLGLFPATVSAQSGNLRLLFHEVRQVSEGGFFNWNGWVVAPNVANVPSKWLVITGPRFQGKNWWSEFNVGAFVRDGETTPTLDNRTNWPFFRPFSLWTNFMWTDFNEVYLYVEVDHPLPGGFVIGLETENTFPDNKSFGPHLKFPLGRSTVHAVYQFHRGENQLWFRMLVNFH